MDDGAPSRGSGRRASPMRAFAGAVRWADGPMRPAHSRRDGLEPKRSRPRRSRAARRKGGVLLASNTFTTPRARVPSIMRADILIHSVTKLSRGIPMPPSAGSRHEGSGRSWAQSNPSGDVGAHAVALRLLSRPTRSYSASPPALRPAPRENAARPHAGPCAAMRAILRVPTPPIPATPIARSRGGSPGESRLARWVSFEIAGRAGGGRRPW